MPVPEVLDESLPMGRQSCKAADADFQTTRRPGIDEPDDPDRRGPLAPAGRRCRDHSYADSAANHLANGIETGKADTQFQAAARAGRVVFHLILECITGREADMVISKSIAKRDLPLMADHMIARRDEHEPVFRKWKGLQFFGGIDLVPDDADLGQVSGDSTHDIAAGTLLQINVDQGMLRQECGQDSGKEFGGRSRIGEQADTPPEAVGILRQFPAHPLQLLNNQVSVMDKGCASWGCANATAMAFEKWCSQTFFHQSNAFAGRCQCHTRPRRTMRDICRLHHEQEQTQIHQIKAHGSFHEELAPSALPEAG